MSNAYALSPSQDFAAPAPRSLPTSAGDAAAPWDSIELVVFDVDGTLYRQGQLRRAMMRELILDAVTSRSPRRLRILRSYRRLRETLAEAETPNFEEVLRQRVAGELGVGVSEIAEAVDSWMHRRPLRHLASCAVPGVADAFSAIRRSGRRIGVLSDYPAEAKLAALGLQADVIVSADDPAVARLKPHPAGLQRVMELARTRPQATLMVGDRAERDGEAARRVGVRCLLRSASPVPAYRTFANYREAPFAEIPAIEGLR